MFTRNDCEYTSRGRNRWMNTKAMVTEVSIDFFADIYVNRKRLLFFLIVFFRVFRVYTLLGVKSSVLKNIILSLICLFNISRAEKEWMKFFFIISISNFLEPVGLWNIINTLETTEWNHHWCFRCVCSLAYVAHW